MTYKVFGKTEVYLEITVVADDEEEAIDVAYQKISGLTSFCGNGGVDQIVGINNRNASIEPSCELEWERAEIVDE